MSTKKHVHEFKMGKSKKVSVCTCDAFKHENLKPDEVIVGIEAEHTPGPWYAEERDPSEWYVTTGQDGRDIAILETISNGKANARLIAAAPELLEALKVAREWIGSDAPAYQNGAWVLKDAQKQVEKAIAKAEGH